jgi:hypothetical protein
LLKHCMIGDVRIIVTGGNSGVGKATAAALAAAGHSVVIACRTIPKAEQAAAMMSGDVAVAHLDLADLASVRKFADSVDGVDVLINNAGVLGLPLTRTADGFEAHMGTKLFGSFRPDMPSRRTDHRSSDFGGELRVRSEPSAHRRLELGDPQVQEVVGLRGIQVGDHALQPRVGQARDADLYDRSGRDGHRYNQRHQRCPAVGA